MVKVGFKVDEGGYEAIFVLVEPYCKEGVGLYTLTMWKGLPSSSRPIETKNWLPLGRGWTEEVGIKCFP